jgi:predicted dehydrogenase
VRQARSQPVRWSAVQAGMMNTGTHCIDFQLYLLGNPNALWVMGSWNGRPTSNIFGHRAEDRCVGIIGYPGDVEGVIENEMNSRYEVGATVYCTEGMMYVQDNSLRYFTSKSNGWQTYNPTDADPSNPYGRAHIDQAYGIVDWIEGNEDMDAKMDARQSRS